MVQYAFSGAYLSGFQLVDLGQLAEGSNQPSLTAELIAPHSIDAPQPLSTSQPTVTITQVIQTQGVYPPNGSATGSDAYWSLGAIHNFAGVYTPAGTVMTSGGLYPISQNTALFSLLGTYYGGDGKSTFAMPDLNSRLAIGSDLFDGSIEYDLGWIYGDDAVSLFRFNMPTKFGGSAQPVSNMQTSLAVNYVINAKGVFPTGYASPLELIGTVWQFGGSYAPGDMIPCDGRLLNIADYEELFFVIGTTFGGDGEFTFAVPDLRGRTIIHAGTNPATQTIYTLGQTVGAAEFTLLSSNMPNAMGEAGQGVDARQPGLVLNYMIAIQGFFPVQTGNGSNDFDAHQPMLGEIVAFAGTQAPPGYVFANGQQMPINQNQALFAILGTTYGGNGQTTFALPDLRGRTLTHQGDSPVGTIQGSETLTLTLDHIPGLDYSGTGFGDFLYGGNADDRIQGLAGNDTLTGYAGNDILIGGEGDDTLSGGEGLDTASYETASAGVVVNLNTAGAQNTIGGGTDTLVSIERLTGSSFSDNLTGLLNADNLIMGGAGHDILVGGNLNDVLGGGAGDDQLQGGTGTDTADYSDATAGVTVYLGNPGLQNTVGAGSDILTSIENVTGSAFADHLVGGTGANILNGGSGNDILEATSGDTLAGGNGDDVYFDYVGSGVTIVELAFGGTDEIRTILSSYTNPANIEILRYMDGGTFNATGHNGAETFYLGAGNDTVNSLGGNDTLYLNGGGNDTANGGANDDIFVYGAALTSADSNDGGTGTDTLVLQGNYAALVLGAANLVGIEGISLQSGSITRWGDTANNFYDYNVTTVDANVTAGQQFRVNAQSLRAGEDFRFDGSAETDGKFLVYAGNGVDTLIGGSGNDIFFFEAGRWANGDTVNGGAGQDALVITGPTNATIASGTLQGIESISVNARFASDPVGTPSYNLTLMDGNIATGARLIVNGSTLGSTQTLNFNGSAENDAFFTLYGGGGADVLTGGGLGDLVYAAGNADTLTGGGGADTFQYRSLSDSNSSARDGIQDFTPGTDKVDLSFIDAKTNIAGNDAFAFIGNAAFSNVAGQLRYENVSGPIWLVQGDVNGDAVSDFEVIVVVVTASPLTAGDFIL